MAHCCHHWRYCGNSCNNLLHDLVRPSFAHIPRPPYPTRTSRTIANSYSAGLPAITYSPSAKKLITELTERIGNWLENLFPILLSQQSTTMTPTKLRSFGHTDQIHEYSNNDPERSGNGDRYDRSNSQISSLPVRPSPVRCTSCTTKPANVCTTVLPTFAPTSAPTPHFSHHSSPWFHHAWSTHSSGTSKPPPLTPPSISDSFC